MVFHMPEIFNRPFSLAVTSVCPETGSFPTDSHHMEEGLRAMPDPSVIARTEAFFHQQHSSSRNDRGKTAFGRALNPAMSIRSGSSPRPCRVLNDDAQVANGQPSSGPSPLRHAVMPHHVQPARAKRSTSAAIRAVALGLA